jgi:hypothetical protein
MASRDSELSFSGCVKVRPGLAKDWMLKRFTICFFVAKPVSNGKLDWDLISGACNVWEFAEFLFYLKELDYDGWITADVAPFRQDAGEIFALNVRFTEQIWTWLDEIDRNIVRECLHKHDFMTIRKMMEPYIFPLLRGGK